jgi:hypothetical protein
MKSSAATVILCFLALMSFSSCDSAVYTYANNTWMSGVNFTNPTPAYGTKNVASANNIQPPKSYCCMVYRLNNLYVFAGISATGYMNDVWRYDMVTKLWTWIKGSATAYPSKSVGALTVLAASNTPGGHYLHTCEYSSVDDSMYVFGGRAYLTTTYGAMNTMWRFDFATSNWALMKGSYVDSPTSSYGTFRVESAQNMLISRMGHAATVNTVGGFFYVHGGRDEAIIYAFNDMWQYNFATTLWSWVSGLNGTSSSGVYGTKGVANSLNLPPSRCDHGFRWHSGRQVMVIFGGNGNLIIIVSGWY